MSLIEIGELIKNIGGFGHHTYENDLFFYFFNRSNISNVRHIQHFIRLEIYYRSIRFEDKIA